MGLKALFQSFVPQNQVFYPMFEDAAENMVKTAVMLNKLLLVDPPLRENICKEIKDLEHKGDDITHGIYDELAKTFITPFDREDIHHLASCIDDVVDLINRGAQSIRLYKPKNLTSEFVAMSELIIQGSQEVRKAIKELRNLKKTYLIHGACIRINEIENQADEIFHNFLSEMFKNESDAIELIKKKDIILTMESATDLLEQVSNVLNTLLIKSA